MYKEAFIDQIIRHLEENLSEYRYKHTLEVANTAEKLALANNIDQNKARLAALLHDISKEMPLIKQIAYVKLAGIELDDCQKKIPAIIHAPAAVGFIQEKWEINDPDILEAVRYHTTGHPEMGDLAKIIFAADFIEPGRKFSRLEKVREILPSDLTKGLIMICNEMVYYHLQANKLIHPTTIELRNKLLICQEEIAGC